jgi:hypothetical protein
LNKTKLLRGFTLLGFLISLAGLLAILVAPGGFSAGKLAAAGIPALAVLGFAWQGLRAWRTPAADGLGLRLEAWLGVGSRYSLIFCLSLIGFLLGAYYLVALQPTLDSLWGVSINYLPALAWWLCILNGVWLITLVVMRQGRFGWHAGVLLIFLGMLWAGLVVHVGLWGETDPRDEDIYAVFLEGDRLLEGGNPYAQAEEADMRRNQKYATYFPVMYLLSWETQLMGYTRFADWIGLWQAVFLFFNLLTACLVFYIPYRKGMLLLALFTPAFWLFNRWTLHVSLNIDIDFPALFFLILSLALLPRRPWLAYLALGLSLGFKQIAILLVPVYLVWAWQSAESRPVRQTLLAGLAIAAIPLVVSLPFIVWNWEGFIRSILISATRNPAAVDWALSIDGMLGWRGLLARAPMLIMLVLIYLLTWRKSLSPFIATMLVMAVFVAFNSVLFQGYFSWLMPFIPLAAYEIASLRRSREV